jgi:hypothetical protein
VKLNSAIQKQKKSINNEKSKEGTRDLLPNVHDNDNDQKAGNRE